MLSAAMETMPLWIWPVAVCVLALGLRLWVKRTPPAAATGRAPTPTPWWDALRSLTRRFPLQASRDAAPITVIARKPITAQHAVVVLAIWDQEIALSVQPGVAPTVLASRPAPVAAQPTAAPEPRHFPGPKVAPPFPLTGASANQAHQAREHWPCA